ncbi:MAG: hypothetical protein JWL69_5044 [Phycisphaerales bacterium]|nr:hypothetical protein [Phycisphaerales bacterium]
MPFHVSTFRPSRGGVEGEAAENDGAKTMEQVKLFRIESCGDYALRAGVILNGNSPPLLKSVDIHDDRSGSRGQHDGCVKNHLAPAHLCDRVDPAVQMQIHPHLCRIPDGGLLESHGRNP